MSHSRPSLEQIFHERIQSLALTLRPGTVAGYRTTVRQFLGHLHAVFPQVRQLSQLRRDPHMLSWLRQLCERNPPLCNKARINQLVCLHRLLDDLAADGHPIQHGLICHRDFPPEPKYLPRPLSPGDDRLLQQELLRTGGLPAHALLLTRATGIRIGECIDLALDCLRQIGPDQWALHVPIGKLHTERLVPADSGIRQIVASILALRAPAPPAHLAYYDGLLIPRSTGRSGFYQTLCKALAAAALRAGCSCTVTPHQLRHSYASEMVRLGVSLPALMALLGHNDIRMTMRYVLVTQQDLQVQFHTARQQADHPHHVPVLAVPNCSPITGLAGIRQALTATRHLLEMYRRGLSGESTRRRILRLDRRLLDVAVQLDLITKDEK